jgi:pyruvate dehydrogenase E2 component (dihydrolipoamide acetyltransferase)
MIIQMKLINARLKGKLSIFNPPEGVILAIGSILKRPVVKKGPIVVGHTMKVTLSSDHHIIDDAVVMHFLQDHKILIEKPV